MLIGADTSILDATTPPELSSGVSSGAHDLSSLESVNLYSGAVNIHIPLLNIESRGEAGYQIALPIERHWNLHTHTASDGTNLVYVLNSSKTPGVNNWGTASVPRFMPGMVVSRVEPPDDGGGGILCQGLQYYAGPLVTRLTFIDSIGAEHELIDMATAGAHLNPVNTQCPGVQTGGANRGTDFLATDGSHISFVSDSPVIDRTLVGTGAAQGLMSGWLSFPDGRRYRLDDGYVSKILDRNGNQTLFTYSGGSAGIVDSSNRTITITYADFQNEFNDRIYYYGANGQQQTITISYTLLSGALTPGQQMMSITNMFPAVYRLEGDNGGASYVAKSITLADSSQYSFFYNSYGELSRMVLPAGGALEYDYPSPSDFSCSNPAVFCLNRGSTPFVYRRLLKRRELPNGSAISRQTMFSYMYGVQDGNGSTVVTATDVDGSGGAAGQIVHHFIGDASQMSASTGYSIADKEKYTEIVDPVKGLLQAISRNWVPPPGADPHYAGAQLTSEITTMGGLSNQVSYEYDQFNNITHKYEYDWGSGSPGPLVRHTTYDYLTNAAHLNASLLRLPTQITVYSGMWNLAALTYFGYDESAAVDAPGIVGHDGNRGVGFNTRGNVTSKLSWINTTNSYASEQYTNDIAGSRISITDPLSRTTTFGYSDPWNTYAHVTSVKNALNQQTTTASYEFNTGRITGSTDLSGVSTAYSYNDPLNRLTQVRRAAGVGPGMESQTNIFYPNPTWTITTTDQNTTGDRAHQTQTVYDGLGRVVQNRMIEDGTNFIGVNTGYDALGRVAAATNPFRTNYQTNANDGLGYQTTTTYDALGRVTRVETADGSATTSVYSGNQVTITEPGGRQRRNTYDALGRLTSVVEDSGGENLLTSYTYDVLDDLTSVTQGGQTRTFTYDSLGRLTNSIQPESGTTLYEYYNDGNLASRTDARGVRTSYIYDAVGRLSEKNYSGGGTQTPMVKYTYGDTAPDPNAVTYGKGRLTKVSNGISTTAILAYDPLGRVLASQQSTGGKAYNVWYKYDLSGALTSETYPSGRQVTTQYDAAGRASKLTGTLGELEKTYMGWIRYAPHGAVDTMQMGNDVWRVYSYNSRLQVERIRDALNNSPDQLLLDQQFTWGTSDNNGNLQSVLANHWTPGSQPLTFKEAFGYDRLNRVTSVVGKDGNETLQWVQSFGYDRYGNRWISSNTLPGSALTPTSNIYNGANRMNATGYL